MSLVFRFVVNSGPGFWIGDVEVLSNDYRSGTSVVKHRVVEKSYDNQLDPDGVYVFISDLTDYQENFFREYLKKAKRFESSMAALIVKALRACRYFPHDLPVSPVDITVRDLYLLLSIKHPMPVNPDVAARAISARQPAGIGK